MHAMTTRILSRTLGRSGIEVSEIGIGCWAIGGAAFNLGLPMGWSGTTDADSLDGLRCALELGAVHFDTADVYGHGHSERLLGRAIEQVPRSRLVIGSKVGYFQGTAPNAYHPLHMQHQLEMSLTNLHTDYLDIYYFHNFHFGDGDQYLDDALATMRRFKAEGKIRAIGLRGPHEYAPDRHTGSGGDKYKRFLQVAERIDPDVIQVRYNLITPTYDDPERDIFRWAAERDVGVVINKPLGQGLLLDKYDPAAPPVFTPGDHRSQKRWFDAVGLEVLHRRLSRIKSRFGQSRADLVRVALQYALHRSSNAAVVVGFKSRAQVEMNLSAAGRSLSASDVEFIRSAMLGIRDEIGEFLRQAEVSSDS